VASKEQAHGTSEVRKRLLTAGGETYDQVNHEVIERYLRGDEFFWLDVMHPGSAGVDWLAETFDLHPLVQDDLRSFGQRPKLDPYDTYSMLVVYGATPDEDGLVEVHCILADHYLITVRRDEAPCFDSLWGRYLGDEPIKPGPLLLYRVVEGLVDSFYPSLAQLDDQFEGIEESILDNPETAQLRQVLQMKRHLLALRKVIGPERDLFAQIVAGTETLPGWSDESMRYFRDAYDHLIRLSDMVDTYRDLLTSTLDVYLSARADHRDDVMKQLTVIATVFLPITFVTGFFGMNFGFLVRNIGSAGAFAAGAAVQLAIVLGILLTFRRRGWI
jgi:magnesium transporter